MNNITTLNRMNHIDIAKGILMIFVIIGHIINLNVYLTTAIKSFIYSFHMPAFFVITGILIKNSNLNFADFIIKIKKLFIRLIIPYILFEFFGGLLQMSLFGSNSVNIKGIIYGIITIRCHIGANWFLPTLFFAEIIFYFFSKIFINKFVKLFFCIILMLLALFVSEEYYIIGIIRRIIVA